MCTGISLYSIDILPKIVVFKLIIPVDFPYLCLQYITKLKQVILVRITTKFFDSIVLTQ